jgi:hypothetical protein
MLAVGSLPGSNEACKFGDNGSFIGGGRFAGRRG